LAKVSSVPAQLRRPASARRDRARATALGLLAGVLLDQFAGDPRRGHPVALFGSAASRLEARMWRDDRAAGAGYAALLNAASAALGLLARRLPPAGGLPISSAAARTSSTRRRSPGPRWSPSRRTRPTPWSPRCYGVRSPACPACSATGR